MRALLRLAPIVTLALAGCAVGPNYKRPTTDTPAHYKAEALGSWKEGRPLDNLPKGEWWNVFGDQTLNDLESRATGANQELKAAMARVEQARVTARVARSELLPTLNADPSFTRQRFSPTQVPSVGGMTANNYRAALDLSYEIDLWGRIRRGFESARADAQASLAAFHNVLLTLHAEVAQNYFGLRALDTEISTVTRTVDLRKEQVQLVRSRFEDGIGNRLDANYRRSKSAFEESIARYRQSILVAFGDVESSLAGIHFLADQAAAQDRAVSSSRLAAELAGERYSAGVVSYLEVVDANRVALQSERAIAQLAGQQLIASVHLIKALGGGWQGQGR